MCAHAHGCAYAYVLECMLGVFVSVYVSSFKCSHACARRLVSRRPCANRRTPSCACLRTCFYLCAFVVREQNAKKRVGARRCACVVMYTVRSHALCLNACICVCTRGNGGGKNGEKNIERSIYPRCWLILVVNFENNGS